MSANPGADGSDCRSQQRIEDQCQWVDTVAPGDADYGADELYDRECRDRRRRAVDHWRLSHNPTGNGAPVAPGAGNATGNRAPQEIRHHDR